MPNTININGYVVEIIVIDLENVNNSSELTLAASVLDVARKSLMINYNRVGLYLGNPGDTGYKNKTVEAIYLGSLNGVCGYRHFWINQNHDGELMISQSVGYGGAGRSTWGIQLAQLNLDDELIKFYKGFSLIN